MLYGTPSMTVLMVQIREVNVAVAQGLMPVPVRVRFRDRAIMVMPVMVVMNMAVFMFECFVLMRVGMALGEVQPETKPHEQRREDESRRHRLSQDQNGQCRSDERCQGVVGPGARRPKVAQCQDEHYKADSHS